MQARGSVETEIPKRLINVKQSRRIIHQGCGWPLSHPRGPVLYEPPNIWESAEVFNKAIAYLFRCRKEVNSTKKQSNDAGNPPSLFPLHYLFLSLSLICWASSYPWLSSPFELGSCHSFPRNSEAADSMPQDIAFRHLPLALPLMAFAHRVRWYQLLWEAFFILQLLHLTPLSATLYIPCDVLWLARSPLRCICGRLIPFLCTWVWSLPRFHSLGFLELQIKPKQWNNPALSPSSPLMVCDNCQP